MAKLFRKLGIFAVAAFWVVGARAVATQPDASPAMEQRPFVICTDVNFWAPFTFVKDGISQGLHVALAKRAFQNLGLDVVIEPWPWNRCMAGGREGYYDAVLSASYQDSRAINFHYPRGAEAAVMSPLRVTQAEYVIVVRGRDKFDWQGKDENLPQPIGLPLGYAQVTALREKGVDVSTAVKYSDLFRMLARGRVNSLIVVRPTAEFYLGHQSYETELAIIDRPHRSTSYYMIVSKSGRIDLAQANQLWGAIAAMREDAVVMQQLTEEVMALLETCYETPNRCD